MIINPKAAYHSRCFGAPCSTPFSMKSKSITKVRDATPITIKENPIPTKKMTNDIYYDNTSDGYTEFEDGTKTQCVSNRLVKFPSNLKHRGVSQTDTRLKSVINLNFFTP